MKKIKIKSKNKYKDLSSQWKTKSPLYIKKSDNRYKQHSAQLKKQGFSDTETWALNSVLAEFILPRLKRFRDIVPCYPPNISYNEWIETLDKIILAFEYVIVDGNGDIYVKSKEEQEKGFKDYEDGIDLFKEYFMDLWW